MASQTMSAVTAESFQSGAVLEQAVTSQPQPEALSSTIKQEAKNFFESELFGALFWGTATLVGGTLALAGAAVLAVATAPVTVPGALALGGMYAVHKFRQWRQGTSSKATGEAGVAEPIQEPEPVAPPKGPALTADELTPGITQYTPEERDFTRLRDKISRLANGHSKAGPKEAPLEFAFRAVSQDGKLQGEVIATTLPLQDRAEINLVHVEREFRGQGIGTQLLRLAEEFARNTHNVRAITVVAPPLNEQTLYEKEGYTKTGQHQIPTNGIFDGYYGMRDTFRKSFEPDLVQAAKESDYQAIADYAEKYPQRVLDQLGRLAEANPDLGKSLTPFYSKTGFFTLDVEDIRGRLTIRALPKQAVKEFESAMRLHLGL